MGLFDWTRAFFGRKNRVLHLDECHFELQAEVYYKKLAIDTCVDLIANALSTCEIQVFEKGKKVRDNNYYALNVQPNQNENATQFFHKAIRQYFYNNECLILMIDDQYHVADDFTCEEFAFKENIYKDITINGLSMNAVYRSSQVVHLKLSDENIIRVIDELYMSFGKLLSSSMNYYKRKNNKRLLIQGDFLRPQDDETQAAIDAMFEGQLKNWFDPDKQGVAFQLQNGYETTDMSDAAGAGKSSDSRDISSLVEDIFNYVAMAFHVPRGLLKGDLADIDKQTDNFIMFALNTLAELIGDEFNRKLYKKKEYLERTYLKMDTSKVKTVDISQLATALDKLFAIGGYSINDVQEELGRDPIDEEYANKRYVTKNYERVDITEANLGGGE